MSAERHTVTFRVEIDGQPIPEDISETIVSAVVDDTLVHGQISSRSRFAIRTASSSPRRRVGFGSAVTVSIVSDVEPVGRELAAR